MNEATTLVWTRRDRASGDPWWYARLGRLRLAVGVACEWCWEWTVDSDDEHDLARGTLDAAPDDEEVDDDDWDYQNIELAQRRCQVVAMALAGEETDARKS